MELISKAKDERAEYNIGSPRLSKEPKRDYVAATQIQNRLVIPITPLTLPIADCRLRISDWLPVYGQIGNRQSQIGNVEGR